MLLLNMVHCLQASLTRQLPAPCRLADLTSCKAGPNVALRYAMAYIDAANDAHCRRMHEAGSIATPSAAEAWESELYDNVGGAERLELRVLACTFLAIKFIGTPLQCRKIEQIHDDTAFGNLHTLNYWDMIGFCA